MVGQRLATLFWDRAVAAVVEMPNKEPEVAICRALALTGVDVIVHFYYIHPSGVTGRREVPF